MSRLAGEKEAHRSKGTEMPVSRHPINVAVLDDYQGVAMSIVDWSKVSDRANIAVFQDHLGNQDAVAERSGAGVWAFPRSPHGSWSRRATIR
jgi:hypothetical protein